jgi:hypothetical protein
VDSSRRRVRVRVGTAVAGLCLVLAGCSYTNPPDVLKVSDPGDGRSGQIASNNDGAVKLRNFLVVSDGNGKPGTLVGAVSNETSQPATVTLTLAQTDQSGQPTPVGTTTVTLKPSEYLQFGDPAGGSGGTTTATPGASASTGVVGPEAATGRVTNYQIPAVQAPTGGFMQLSARTAGGGGTLIDVPILPPVGEYAYLAPQASASASPTSSPTPSGSVSPSVDTSGAATQTASASPSATP